MPANKEAIAKKKTILWADDELFHTSLLADVLEVEGFRVLKAENATAAVRILEERKGQIDLAILDVMMPPGEQFDELTAMQGFQSGLLLGRWIREHYPRVPIIGFSLHESPDVSAWFEEYAEGFLSKRTKRWELVEHIKRKFGKNRKPKIFIVHGRDEPAKHALVHYIQNTLKLGTPIILHEQPSLGRAITEKFRDAAEDAEIVFVLLTPDDLVASPSDDDELKRRARQNVIFEMGYFLAKLQRNRGRLILLHKGEVELPSDIAGLLCIDISQGIEAASESIRRELAQWL